MKHTIRNLAVSNLKKDRSSSVLVVLSIVITTLLLTLLMSMSYGIIKNNRVNAGALYGDYYGTFKGVTKENIKKMKLRVEFTDIGSRAWFGSIESDRDMALYWADEAVRDITGLEKRLAEGSFPKGENEIAAEPAFFEQFGIKQPAIGDKVTINYRENLNETFAPETFIISGLLKSTETGGLETSYPGYVSKVCYESRIPVKEQEYSVYFKLDESLDITSDNAEEYIKDLGEKCGIERKNASENKGYLLYKLDPGHETIMGCSMISFIVIFFSVIVIYNIFHVGITRKIQEYGKLKAIGATRRQMKRVIWNEGMILAAIGVPIGILSGYVTASIAFSIIMQLKELEGMTKVSLFSMPLLLFAAAVGFLTVWTALIKPMKIVASISPVEAMRYQESSKSGKGMRKGKKELDIMSITWANLTGNRRRTLSTIIAMGLSGVLFIVVANFMGNMDVEYDARSYVEYGKFQVELDYAMNDTAYPENNLNNILKDNPFSNDIMEKIKNIDGVTDIKVRKLLYADMTDKNGKKTGENVSICILDRESFDTILNDGGYLGEFDYDSVTEKQGIVNGWSYYMEENGYAVGKEVFMRIADGENETPVQAPMMGSFGRLNGELAMTEDTYEALKLTGNMTADIWVDCKDSDEAGIGNALNEMFRGTTHVEITSYQSALELSQNSMSMLRVIFYTLTILIAAISFLNMANTIITSMITRKQEFGVLQAIGMTNRQLNRSLQMEGLFFTLGTVLVSVAVGCPLGYLMFHYGKKNVWIGLHIYHFPWREILLMIAAIALLQVVLSFILSRNMKKESLVERIRYQE